MLRPFSSSFQRMAKKAFQKDPRRGDDRNLVLVDQDFGQPDLEDRMWLFWVRNRSAIVGGAVLVIVAILGYIVWHAVGTYSLGAMQATYQETGAKPEAKLEFAKQYEGHALAGVAALEAADSFYKDKHFEKAAAAYVFAQKNFSPKVPVQSASMARALVGEAFALQASGKQEAGAAILQRLADDNRFPMADRGQAMYNLVLLALEKQSLEEARQWLDTMDKVLPANNPWQQKKLMLIMQEPRLLKPVEEGVQPSPDAQ